MMTTQQILQAMGSMQSDAQNALPVIPNNGNPGGANNMPQLASLDSPPVAAPNPLQWLEPSPAMSNTKSLLEAQYNKLLREQMNARTSEGQFNTVVDPTTGGWEAQILDNQGLPVDETYPTVPIRGTDMNIPQRVPNRAMPVIPQAQGRQP